MELSRRGERRGGGRLFRPGLRARTGAAGRLDREDPEAWESLVQLAVQQAARHRAVAEVVAICSEPLLAAALQRCGFIARSSRPLLVRANGVRLPAAGIRIQMLDDDTAYRHGGSRNFWV